MRVVCDNCGAVYKIADSKLTKDVNKATCKRCGHKIIIYRPGGEATPAKPLPPPPADEPEERTVIKNVPELEKLNPSQSVPSIGSLTAELRAISVPGLKAPAPAPAPAALGPASTVPPKPSAPKPPPLPVKPPPVPVKAPPIPTPQPAVKPPPGIPPKDSPHTQVYNGPGPAQTTPVPKAPPVVPAPQGPTTGPPRRAPAPPPPRPPASAAPTPVPSAPPRPVPAPPTPTPAPPAPAMPKVATKTAAVEAPGGAAALSAVAFAGAVGLVGCVAAVLAPAPAGQVGIGMAAFGAAGALFISLLSDRGRKSDKTALALILALVIGGAIGAMAFARGADSKPAAKAEPTPEETPADAFETAVKAPEPTGGAEEATPADADPDGLSDEEKAKVREFSEGDIAGLGRTAEPEPTPKPAPVRAERPEPTPRPKPEPTPEPKKEAPRNEMLSSGPAKPQATPEPKKADKPKDDKPSLFVVDTIIRNSADIRRCIGVEKARGTEVDGKIYMKFTIEPEGTVKRARVTTSRFQGTSLDKCLSREVDALKFPPFNGQAQTVSYALLVGS